MIFSYGDVEKMTFRIQFIRFVSNRCVQRMIVDMLSRYPLFVLYEYI